MLGCGMCEPETQTRRAPGTKGENFSSTTSLRTILRERRFRFSVCTCAVPREQSHSHTWLLDAVLTKHREESRAAQHEEKHDCGRHARAPKPASRGGVTARRPGEESTARGWQSTSGRQHGLHAPPRRHVRAGGLHGGVGTRSGCSSKSRWQRDAPSSTTVGSAAERGVWRRVARRQVRATQQWRRVARWRRAGERARPARREGEGEGRHRREAHAVALRHEGGRVE